jgi:hypothetical protein
MNYQETTSKAPFALKVYPCGVCFLCLMRTFEDLKEPDTQLSSLIGNEEAIALRLATFLYPRISPIPLN